MRKTDISSHISSVIYLQIRSLHSTVAKVADSSLSCNIAVYVMIRLATTKSDVINVHE